MKLTSRIASNMVLGEPSNDILTSDGVSKISCINPKQKSTSLSGFKLPGSLGGDLRDGQCMGSTVSVIRDFCFGEFGHS